jgi:hypothetical protein
LEHPLVAKTGVMQSGQRVLCEIIHWSKQVRMATTARPAPIKVSSVSEFTIE